MTSYVFLLTDDNERLCSVVHKVCTGDHRIRQHKGKVTIAGASKINTVVQEAIGLDSTGLEKHFFKPETYQLLDGLARGVEKDGMLSFDTRVGCAASAHNSWQVWRQQYERPHVWLRFMNERYGLTCENYVVNAAVTRCLWAYFFGGGSRHSIGALDSPTGYAHFVYKGPLLPEEASTVFRWSEFDSHTWLLKSRALYGNAVWPHASTEAAVAGLVGSAQDRARAMDARLVMPYVDDARFGRTRVSAPCVNVTVKEWLEAFGLLVEKTKAAEADKTLDIW